MDHKSKFERIIDLAAQLSVAAGVLFAAAQLWQNRAFELRKNAVDALGPLQSREYKVAQRTILDRQRYGKPTDAEFIADDLNYVAGVFEHISISYFNGTVDRAIIDEHVVASLPEVDAALKFFGYPNPGMARVQRLCDTVQAHHKP